MFNVKKISIRVDGNSEIGLGHIFRCISLAQILHPRFEIVFYCIYIPDSIKITIEQLGLRCIGIESESDFFSRINNTDIIVLDGYKFDAQYQINIKKRGNKLVYIDDMCNMHYYSDLIINHAPGIESTQYLSESYTDFALGLDYSLLRPSFINATKNIKNHRKNSSLIISFGGSDFQNLTNKTLQTIEKLNFRFSSIDIVIGPSYLYEEKLNEIIANFSEVIILHKSLSEHEMCKLFLTNEFALVPSSGVLFEALACGCKPISGFYIDNQENIYKGFKELMCIIPVEDFSESNLINGLNQIYDFEFKSVIDGLSPQRLINKFEKL
jgi:UDP-2,4-diacetamido-2,4,6-trideoxy-beta-L-altropyranose hydrolase